MKRFLEECAEQLGLEIDDPLACVLADDVLNLMETMTKEQAIELVKIRESIVAKKLEEFELGLETDIPM